MTKFRKTIDRVLSGTSDASIRFDEICGLLVRLGFEERVRGSHHIFAHREIVEILNLQPRGSQAKIWQVKQVREVILKYKLGGAIDDGE